VLFNRYDNKAGEIAPSAQPLPRSRADVLHYVQENTRLTEESVVGRGTEPALHRCAPSVPPPPPPAVESPRSCAQALLAAPTITG
jgi:hypothetical protein